MTQERDKSILLNGEYKVQNETLREDREKGVILNQKLANDLTNEQRKNEDLKLQVQKWTDEANVFQEKNKSISDKIFTIRSFFLRLLQS